MTHPNSYPIKFRVICINEPNKNDGSWHAFTFMRIYEAEYAIDIVKGELLLRVWDTKYQNYEFTVSEFLDFFKMVKCKNARNKIKYKR